MQELIQIYEKNLSFVEKSQKKKATQFIKKLDSFIHAPTNSKEIERMRPYALNDGIVQLVLRTIEPYYKRKNRLYYDALNGDVSKYEIIIFWYSFCVLLLDQNKTGYAFVEQLICDFIEMKHPDFDLLRRLFIDAQTTDYDDLKPMVFDHYKNVQKESSINKWAKSIGIEFPVDKQWDFYFYIESEDQMYSLMLRSSNPDGVGLGWQLDLYNKPDSEDIFSARRPSKIVMTVGKKRYALATQACPENLQTLLLEIEDTLYTKFQTQMGLSYFSRGIKNKKKINDWLSHIHSKR